MRGQASVELNDIINEFYDSNDYKTHFSPGLSQWTHGPWGAILCKKISNTFQKGFYVGFSFINNGKGICLNLGQAFTEIEQDKKIQDNLAELEFRASFLRENIKKIPEGFLNPEIDTKNQNREFTGPGHIIDKFYSVEDLNNEKLLLDDLKAIMDVYNELIPIYKQKFMLEVPIQTEEPHSEYSKNKPKVWRITPGEADSIDKLWPIFRDNGYIGIGWFGNKLLQKDYREFKSEGEIKEFLIKHDKKSDKTTSHKMIWNFTHNINERDYIIANRGRNKVLGIGIIKSNYICPNDSENPQFDEEYTHLRKVDWLITEEFELDTKIFFARSTINELDRSKWNEVLIKYYKNNNFDLIEELFNEFKTDYLTKEIGISHYKSYNQESNLLKNYFKKIQEDPSVMENTDDPIINYIVPIKRPSVSSVGFKSFKAFKYTDEQIPSLTKAIYNLIIDLNNSENFEDQKNIIKLFKSSDYSKGSQAGVISPLLHGLNRKFLIINKKTVDTVNFVSKIMDIKISINTELLDYIDNNEKLKEFLQVVSKKVPEFTDVDKFDAFCHWICDKSLAGYAKGNILPIIGIPINDKFKTESLNTNFKSFAEFLIDKGYYFELEMIENFLLSLKAKRFVILTGNSGTGKTKIAQLFAQYVSDSNIQTSISTQVKVGKAAKNRGWTLKKDVLDDLGIPNINGSYDIKIDGINGKGNLSLLSQLFYENNDNIIQSRLTEMENSDPDQKIDIAIILPANNNVQYKIVPVGANWTENRHIIGFYNVITNEYITSDALELILEASKLENKDKPFFLILDEMNLSHVERYFADFLSAMESDEYINLHKSMDTTTVS